MPSILAMCVLLVIRFCRHHVPASTSPTPLHVLLCVPALTSHQVAAQLLEPHVLNCQIDAGRSPKGRVEGGVRGVQRTVARMLHTGHRRAGR